MTEIALVLLFAILVEAVVEGIKEVKDNGKIQMPVLLSLIVSMLATVSFQIDLFALLGFASAVPYVGYILTAVIVSRGSNYVSDLVSKVTNKQ